MKIILISFQILVIVGLSAMVICPQSINAALQDQVFPPNSSPFGLSYKNWGFALWQWWLSIPKQVAPIPDPAKWNPCLVGLGYPVVMLANPIIGINTPKVTYNCDIPKDRAILIFGITEICPYDATHKSDEDLRKCVKARDDWAKHQIIIDGKSVENVTQYRFTTDFANFTYPKGNMQDLPAGTFRTLLDGTWLMLKPMSAGNHRIEVHVVQIIPGQESENLFLNLIYNLHIS